MCDIVQLLLSFDSVSVVSLLITCIVLFVRSMTAQLDVLLQTYRVHLIVSHSLMASDNSTSIQVYGTNYACRIQRRATKLIPGLRNLRYEERLKNVV